MWVDWIYNGLKTVHLRLLALLPHRLVPAGRATVLKTVHLRLLALFLPTGTVGEAGVKLQGKRRRKSRELP